MKGIGWSEKVDLGDLKGSGQMHRRGIYRHQEARARDDCGQGQKVEPR